MILAKLSEKQCSKLTLTVGRGKRVCTHTLHDFSVPKDSLHFWFSLVTLNSRKHGSLSLTAELVGA
jgi:hypothetical protein